MGEYSDIEGYCLSGAKLRIKLSMTEPIECPFCHKGIETQPLTFFMPTRDNAEVFLKCKLCKSSFIGYSKLGQHSYYHINKLSPGKHKIRKFEDEISTLSSTFVKIYGESEFAEQENLMDICGVGYRKALEFLIKDFLISKFPEQEQLIKEKSLGNCIGEMIDNPRIKEIAKRATWIGNDETHYFKKWEDKDLSDLKRLLDITIHFISMEIESDKYMKEM